MGPAGVSDSVPFQLVSMEGTASGVHRVGGCYQPQPTKLDSSGFLLCCHVHDAALEPGGPQPHGAA
jgi:hypothetical protein